MKQWDAFKRYEVFVSSTYRDLKRERSIVMKTILDMGHFPSGMEEFPATDQDQFDYIKKIIDTADYFILILGGYLGSFVDIEKQISYTRKEYEYARMIRIPIIVFVKSNKNGEPLIKETNLDRIRLYQDFLDESQKNRMRGSFFRAEELSGLVLHSLSEEVRSHPRCGWIRDYKPDFISNELLLRGRLLEWIYIDKSIYKNKNKTKIIKLPQLEITVFYGPESQGAFVLACSTGENSAHDFFYEIRQNEIDCFDGEGYLRGDYRVQLSFAKLGNIEETLLFLSVGNGQTGMITKIYRIGRFDYKFIGSISGQAFMSVDYSLSVPNGTQGIYDTYLFCEGMIMRAEGLNNKRLIDFDDTTG